MKKTLTILLFSISIFFFLFACTEDEPIIKKNIVLINGRTVNISEGILVSQGKLSSQEKAGYSFRLILFTSGIKFSSTGDLLGRGDVIIFELYSSTSSELTTGTYKFDPYKNQDANSFDYGEFILGYSLTDWMCEAYDYIKDGTITIKKTSNTYEIKIDCIVMSDGKLTGYYKGAPTFYNWTTRKMPQ